MKTRICATIECAIVEKLSRWLGPPLGSTDRVVLAGTVDVVVNIADVVDVNGN